MNHRRALLTFVSLTLAAIFSTEVRAQGASQASAFTRNFIQKRASVSPYLALAFQQTTPQNPNAIAVYQNRVKPQLEARRQARMEQMQTGNLRNQLNSIGRPVSTASNLSSMRGGVGQQTGVVSTGHSTGFLTYLHYYPMAGRR